MTVKKFFGGVLLVFVALSLSVLAARELRSWAPATPASTPATADVPTPTPAPSVAPSPAPPPQSAVSPAAAAGALASPALQPASPAAPSAVATNSGPRKVVVYYFHTTARCPTCHKIEEYTKEALTGFADQVKAGRLEFITVNVDTPENQHFVKDYGLYTKSVVLSEVVKGNQTRFKNLAQVWELHQDKEIFIKYISNEVSAYLADK